MSKVVLFTGGGTGGHIFPGIAVIEKLRERDPSLSISWIGGSSALEQEIAERFGVPYLRIPAGKLRRYFSFRNLLDLFKIAGALVASLRVVRKLKPALLFSKGGFVSVPPVLAARLLKVPIVTHESDFDPGLATRINSRFADTICVAYEESASFFSPSARPRLVVTGNPVREEILRGNAERGRAAVAAPPDRPLLLVVGGSQGAHEINELIASLLPRLLRTWFIVHQMGKADFRPSERQGYVTVDFFEESYPDILAAADLLVCRSGAGTLWELAACGKPSILIPLGSESSRGDQLRNAAIFERRGASVVLKSPSPATLLETVEALERDPARRASMAASARSVGGRDAAGLIADLIQDRIGEKHADRSP